MKSRDTFIFYRSIYESAKELSSEDRLMLYDAVIEYSLDFKARKLVGLPKAFFTLVQPILAKGNKNYINGSKAKRKPNGSETEGYKDKDKDKDNNKDKYNNKEKDIETSLFNFRSYMDVKEWLETNPLVNGKNKQFEFEGELIKVSSKGVPYYQSSQRDMDFNKRKVFYRYLFDNQGLLK